MSVSRLHAGLLEAAAQELDRNLRAFTWGEAFRADYLREHHGQLEQLAHLIDGGVHLHGRMLWAKQLLRRVLRPFLVHQSRIDRLFIARFVDLTEALNQTSLALGGLREEVRNDLDYQENRFRTGAIGGPRSANGVQSARSANRLRVAESTESLEIPDGARLLLGRTPVMRPGYLRVAPHDAGADVSVSLDAIPARTGSVAELVVANVLEDYSASEVRYVLLPHWASLLRPGGWLTVIADDFGAITDRLRDGQIDTELFAHAIFGDGERARKSAFTPETLQLLAEEAGLIDVRIAERAERPEAGVYGFELTATAPAA
jgi:hypothetical protein